MPRPPSALPPHLHGRAFRVADARLPAQRLRARDLRSPVHGVRMPAEHTSLAHTCAAIALSLPTAAVFSHDTAARLWRLPLPHRTGGPVHITTPTGVRARRGAEITGHQRHLSAADVVVLGGIRVTAPGRTFTDLADALTLEELVVVGDQIARRWGCEHIREAIGRVRANRRIRMLHEAYSLLDPASEPPKESELRLLLTRAGIGSLVSNLNVFDSSGHFVARVDLALRDAKIAIEYEGDHHREKEQWRRDIARRRRLEAEGWIYIPVTQSDLRDPARLLSDIRAAIARRS